MSKSDLKILEQAFSKEIESALSGGLPIIQNKSLAAKKLAEDGYLHSVEIKLGGRFPLTVMGYSLSELGRITYCFSCD